MKEKKDVLKNFEVSLKNAQNNAICLTQRAVAKSNIKDIISQVDEVEFKREDLQNIGHELLGILDNLVYDEVAKNFLDSFVVDEGIRQNDMTYKEKIQEGITKLCTMLNENKPMAAASKNEKERRKEYDRLLKCLKMVSEALKDSQKEAVFIAGSLNMLAEASDVCASGWKDIITNVMTSFKDDIERKYKGIDYEQDEMKKLVQQVFWEAKESVTRHLGNKYIRENGIYVFERPHYIDIFTKVFNENYQLNLPQIDLKDSCLHWGQEGEIKNKFEQSIEDEQVYNQIYNKACEFFYDKFTGNSAPYGVLADWARDYIKRNNLKEDVEDVSEFLSTYIMAGEYSDKIRYIAIKEIMKDYGVIAEVSNKDKEWTASEDKYGVWQERLLQDVTTKEEIEKINKELIELYTQGADISFAFRYIGKSGDYGVIKLDTIKSIVKLGVMRDNNLLLSLCKAKQVAIVNLLLDIKGLKLNIQNNDGDTALMLAIKNNMGDEIINKLLKCGASINVKNNEKETALMLAIKNGLNGQIIGQLVENEVRINHKDKYGNTPLMLAIKYGCSKEIINILLDYKAGMVASLFGRAINVNLSNEQKETALMLAIKHGAHDDIIKRLIKEGLYIDKINNKGETALMLAIKYKSSKEVVDEILRRGADIDCKNMYGETVYVYLCKYNASPKIIKTILPQMNQKELNKNGETMLMLAIKHGSSGEIINTVLGLGADVNEINNKCQTALMYAIRYTNDTNLIKVLLNKGINVNKRAITGKTSIMYALKYNSSPDVIKLLLDNGANVHLKDKRGFSALMYAQKYKVSQEIKETLLLINPKRLERINVMIKDKGKDREI